MPRHLLHTFARLGHNDRRCGWYYSNYGRLNSPHAHEAALTTAAAAGEMGKMVFFDEERRAEWNREYAVAPRGGIRAGFHSVSSFYLCFLSSALFTKIGTFGS